MTTAAVSGAVVASPPPASIVAAIREIGHGNDVAGVLLIVTNNSGDRLTFGLALERARVDSIKVEMVVIGEDGALIVTHKRQQGSEVCVVRSWYTMYLGHRKR